MRANGICVWLLLNMMLMGMMGYMYLLWVQYWKYSRSTTAIARDTYEKGNAIFRFDDSDTIQIRQGRPRIRPNNADIGSESEFMFPIYDPGNDINEKEPETTPTTTTTTTTTTIPPEMLEKMVEKHKTRMTVEFRNSQMNDGNSLVKPENRYGVKFRGTKAKGTLSRQRLLCALRKEEIRTLRDGDEPFTVEGMAKYFPHQGILEGTHYNTCAVVSSAGSLKGSNLGQFIDSHDAVVRFNHAPVEGMEKDVGSKTTLRILNSQILTKPKFDFWGSPLYRNVSILVWDPSNYSASLAQWYASPDYPVFPEFFRRRLMFPYESLHFLHPASMWNLWNFLQTFTHTNVAPHPPSSGFLGLALMLHHCNVVNVMEFIPSIRFSKQCHYWEPPSSHPGCTFGEWHPLATEKLLTLGMNAADDLTTYSKGYVSVPGFSQVFCPSDNPG